MNGNDQPTVSVVIAAFNANRWIKESIESVLRQTRQDFELIVVDDGSTDHTADIVKQFGPQLNYISQENQGQPAARNAGIRAARGRYIAFLDADDLWHPGKLELQTQLFEENPALKWSYTDALLFDTESGRVLHAASFEHLLHEDDILYPLLLGNFILSATPMIRRDVFNTLGYFNEDPSLRNGEDWEMWLRIAGQFPVGVIRKPLAKVRLHKTSMRGKMDFDYALKSRLAILKTALDRNPELANEVRNRARSNVYTALGRWALNREEREKAHRFFAQALRHAPASRYAWTYAIASWLPRSILRLLGGLRQLFRSTKNKSYPRVIKTSS